MKAIGLDFGTESLRGVLVDVAGGAEIGSAVAEYEHGVIEGKYHDPQDYLSATRRVMDRLGRADAIGVAATSCSVLACRTDGTPVSRVKIWKNHDAQPQADRIHERAHNEPWLRRYGRISSEWFFPKVLHTLETEPEVFRTADRFVEKGDWIVWQLTGRETRNGCAAGYKAMWHKREGFPVDFLRGLGIPEKKYAGEVLPPGTQAGRWQEIPVSVAVIDAHASVPAAGISGPGTMLLVMGTSLCHMILSDREVPVPGSCGVVEDGILPGFFGYESGQAAAGDLLAWYTREFRVAHEASPGPGRLVALDWVNGSRELQRSDLSGLIVGLTLETKPAEIYRAFVESIAFGTRRIVEAYEAAGVAVRELRACGGLAEKNPFLMQVFADVTGRTLRVARSPHATALGAAIFGAMAAGLPTERLGGVGDVAYAPDRAAHEAYGRLYRIYNELHDRFSDGRIMSSLKGA